jgi:hypothetical protein
VLAGIARDWASFGAILTCAVLLFFVAAESCVREPQRYSSVAVLLLCGLMAMTLEAHKFSPSSR